MSIHPDIEARQRNIHPPHSPTTVKVKYVTYLYDKATKKVRAYNVFRMGPLLKKAEKGKRLDEVVYSKTAYTIADAIKFLAEGDAAVAARKAEIRRAVEEENPEAAAAGLAAIKAGRAKRARLAAADTEVVDVDASDGDAEAGARPLKQARAEKPREATLDDFF